LRDSAVSEELRVRCRTCYQRLKAEIAGTEGQRDVACAYYDSLLAHFDSVLAGSDERVVDERWARPWIGLYSAYLGDTDRAIEAAERAVEFLPVSTDAVTGATYLQILAEVYTLTGEYEKAIQTLDTLLSIPSGLSVAILRLDPLWDPLRSSPHFQEMLEYYE
jgi:tetratricopeptide (TPR) repeat protein